MPDALAVRIRIAAIVTDVLDLADENGLIDVGIHLDAALVSLRHERSPPPSDPPHHAEPLRDQEHRA